MLLPGGGRVGSDRLTALSLARVDTGEELWQQELAERGGRIVTTGYTSPGNMKGELWRPDAESNESFFGIPEADLMKQELVARGLHPSIIHVERHSITSETNLIRAEHEDLFGAGDRQPVVIVSQLSHLERLMSIGRHVLRRPFIGVAAHEVPGETFADSRFAQLASWYVLRGINSTAPDLEAIAKTESRAQKVWAVANMLGRVVTLPSMRHYTDPA